MKHPLHRQRGLTLVEILVALGISAILLTGAIQIFVSSKLSYTISEANARVQEGGRFAIEFINNDLRMAGHLGCFRSSFTAVENILNDPDDFGWNLEAPVEGHEWTGGGWSPALPAALAGQVLNGTDVLVTRGLARDSVLLVDPFSDGTVLLVDAATNNIDLGDIVMVSACNRGSVVQITGVDPDGAQVRLTHDAGGAAPGNSTSTIINIFGAGAEVGRIETNAYYIGLGEMDEPALFRSTLINIGGTPQMQTQELVDGVENLQILYGEDTDGDGIANRYVGAHEATMDNVVSMRVSLLLRTNDNIASSAQTYVYDGDTVDATDLRVRRVFSSTVKLRNRGVL